MQKLMLSLDKKILQKESRVAARMIEYGKIDELFILIPHPEKQTINLSPTVRIQTTGGNKLQQLHRLKKVGKSLIEKNNISFITTQDPFFLGLVGKWLKQKTGVTLEVQLHGDFYSNNYYKTNSIKSRIQYEIGKKVIPSADKIRVAGQRIKKSLADIGIAENKITIKPATITKSKTITKKDIHAEYPGYDKISLFVGRFETVKNIPWLIDIFSEVIKKQNNLLILMGDGSQKEEIELLIKNKNLEKNIKIKPWSEDPLEYYASADCLLLPSHSEGYGMVVIEAIESGCKVIMNDVGVANYEIKPSKQVHIIDTKDRQEWIKELKEI